MNATKTPSRKRQEIQVAPDRPRAAPLPEALAAQKVMLLQLCGKGEGHRPRGPQTAYRLICAAETKEEALAQIGSSWEREGDILQIPMRQLIGVTHEKPKSLQEAEARIEIQYEAFQAYQAKVKAEFLSRVQQSDQEAKDSPGIVQPPDAQDVRDAAIAEMPCPLDVQEIARNAAASKGTRGFKRPAEEQNVALVGHVPLADPDDESMPVDFQEPLLVILGVFPSNEEARDYGITLVDAACDVKLTTVTMGEWVFPYLLGTDLNTQIDRVIQENDRIREVEGSSESKIQSQRQIQEIWLDSLDKKAEQAAAGAQGEPVASGEDQGVLEPAAGGPVASGEDQGVQEPVASGEDPEPESKPEPEPEPESKSEPELP